LGTQSVQGPTFTCNLQQPDFVPFELDLVSKITGIVGTTTEISELLDSEKLGKIGKRQHLPDHNSVCVKKTILPISPPLVLFPILFDLRPPLVTEPPVTGNTFLHIHSIQAPRY